jgi:hypothetical protein
MPPAVYELLIPGREWLLNLSLYRSAAEIGMDLIPGPPTSRSLNTIVAQLKNCSFWVNITIELKSTNNNKQNTIKINTLKAISKYYKAVLVVSTLYFAHFSNTSLPDWAILHSTSNIYRKKSRHFRQDHNLERNTATASIFTFWWLLVPLFFKCQNYRLLLCSYLRETEPIWAARMPVDKGGKVVKAIMHSPQPSSTVICPFTFQPEVWCPDSCPAVTRRLPETW